LLAPLFLKRFFDIAFSLAILLLASPFLLLIYCAIRLISPGNPIYSQLRYGQGGRPFLCYKFRTMHPDAEERLKELLEQNPDLKREWELNQKLAEDPRVFEFGHFLRKTSLDELPQFWNVLKGDLSIVGPRPYMLSQKEALENYSQILRVRPGITGLWQTSGRSQTTFKERLILDALYVDRQSFLFDLKLILKTISQFLLSRNAY
jgi:exopolysaccharide production protein ExoY